MVGRRQTDRQVEGSRCSHPKPLVCFQEEPPFAADPAVPISSAGLEAGDGQKFGTEWERLSGRLGCSQELRSAEYHRRGNGLVVTAPPCISKAEQADVH